MEEWTVGGTALTSLMDVERRHGIVIIHFSYHAVLGSCEMSHSGVPLIISLKIVFKLEEYFLIFCLYLGFDISSN